LKRGCGVTEDRTYRDSDSVYIVAKGTKTLYGRAYVEFWEVVDKWDYEIVSDTKLVTETRYRTKTVTETKYRTVTRYRQVSLFEAIFG